MAEWNEMRVRSRPDTSPKCAARGSLVSGSENCPSFDASSLCKIPDPLQTAAVPPESPGSVGFTGGDVNIECPGRSDCCQTWLLDMDMNMDMNMDMAMVKWNFQITDSGKLKGRH